MWSFILSEVSPWIIGAGGALLAFVIAYFKGRGDGKALERTKTTEAELQLRKQYDETNSRPVDRDTAYRELRDREGKR